MRSTNISIMQVIKKPEEIPMRLFKCMLNQANFIGPCTEEVTVKLWLDSLYKSYNHISRLFGLGDLISDKNLEKSCTRALYYGFHSMKIIEIIIEDQLHRLPLSDKSNIYGEKILFDFL